MAFDEDAANLFLRVGVAVTLLLSVVKKFMAPKKVAGLFKTMLGFGSVTFVYVVAVVLLLASLGLLVGWQVRPIGWGLSVFFTVSIVAGLAQGIPAFLKNLPPAVWKDPALLGASLALAYGGAGSHSVDNN